MNRTLCLAAAASIFAGCGGGPTDVQLAPPAAGTGFQLATPTYTVASGTESQRCYFFSAPPEETWINHVTSALNPGSHHFTVFRVRTIVKLGGSPGDLVDGGECFNVSNWADWPLVTNQQNSDVGHTGFDWQYPAGVGQRFAPGELLMLQIHYVNVAAQNTPGNAKGLVNFYTVDKSKVTAELGTLFGVTHHVRVCPGDTDAKASGICRFNSASVTLAAANGHTHRRGTGFTMSMMKSAADPAPAKFYESHTWHDPVFSNELGVSVPTGGGVRWDCDYAMAANECANAQDSCCATFGPREDTQEHCNAFVYYYPKTNDVTCVDN